MESQKNNNNGNIQTSATSSKEHNIKKVATATVVITKQNNNTMNKNTSNNSCTSIGNSNNYRCVIISKVTGWKVNNNRKAIFNELQAAEKYLIVNPNYPKRNYEVIPQSFLESSETIFLEWNRDAPG